MMHSLLLSSRPARARALLWSVLFALTLALLLAGCTVTPAPPAGSPTPVATLASGNWEEIQRLGTLA